jgi:ribonuclease Z
MGWLGRFVAMVAVVALVLSVGWQGLARFDQARKAVFTQWADTSLGRPALADDTGPSAQAEPIKVVACGADGDFARARTAGACTAVLAGGHTFVFDVGPGAVAGLIQAGVPLQGIDAVFISHVHADQIGDLGELRAQSWMEGRSGPLPIFGWGIEPIVDGFNMAYTGDTNLRVLTHGEATLPPDGAALVARPLRRSKEGALMAPEGGPDTPGGTPDAPRPVPVMALNGVTVTAIDLPHGKGGTIGWRISHGGRSVFIAMDAEAGEALAIAARGADVLVASAVDPQFEDWARQGHARYGRIMGREIRDTARSGALRDRARQAGVKFLLVATPFANAEGPMMAAALERITPPGAKAAFARPGLTLSLPEGGKTVLVERTP